jgi:hypothetical protein
MFRKVFLAGVIAALVFSLTACVIEFDNAESIVSRATKEYKETVDLSDKYQQVQSMELDLDMKMAKAVIGSVADKLAEVEFAYNDEALKPEFTVKEDKISIKNVLEKFSLGKPINEWNVGITDKLPLEVELNADASDVDMDMSHMMISSMNAQINASSAKIYFDEPNKEPFDKFKLDANASSVNLYGGGNIGFDVLDISANASKLVVDLTGANNSDGEVRIDANASSVRLKLPENVGVRIVVDKYEISSVKVNNDELLSRSEKEYISKDYEDAEKILKIYVDLNVTTLTIE